MSYQTVKGTYDLLPDRMVKFMKVTADTRFTPSSHCGTLTVLCTRC